MAFRDRFKDGIIDIIKLHGCIKHSELFVTILSELQNKNFMFIESDINGSTATIFRNTIDNLVQDI